MEGLKSLGEQQTLSYQMFELRHNMSFATTKKLCSKHSKTRVSFQFIYVTIIG